MRNILVAALLACALADAAAQRPAQPFRLDQVKGYPFPEELSAATAADRIAWAFNERGHRNIWVAEAPNWAARSITHFDQDDGQELTSVSLSPRGDHVVFVRGGDHDANWDGGVPVNPSSSPVPPLVQVWSVPFSGGSPTAIGDGDFPAISPRGHAVAYVHDREVWIAPLDGSSAARRLFVIRGTPGELAWSPDGARLAFVADRGDHSFVGVFENDTTPIRWMAPSTGRDFSPRWSPDGSRIAFVRRPGIGGPPETILIRAVQQWTIWVADVATGVGHEIWRSSDTPRGSLPPTDGGPNLFYAADGRIAFLSYEDGWPHLYSLSDQGGKPMLLTPGNFMVEHVKLSSDRSFMVFSANTGPDANDIDRRHVLRVSLDRAHATLLTPGAGLEWSPVVVGARARIAYLGATDRRPPLPTVLESAAAPPRIIAQERIPADFPTATLVSPHAVTFRSSDGLTIHAQLFERPGGDARKPAVVFAHGGPARQMLLGWNYSSYYSNTYAMNQYLASLGFVVLAVNYRLGIGYGYDFHRPPHSYAQGASELLDVRAAGEYLRSLPQVDGARIGIYGGSYGGFLTAMALARAPDVFAAGVDIHGVADFTADNGTRIGGLAWRYEKGDRAEAADVAWQASPVSSLEKWRAPVLFIHGDDDRSVRFSHTIDFERRLTLRGLPFEELVIPDDTHHWMRHANALRVWDAAARFFERKLGPLQ